MRSKRSIAEKPGAASFPRHRYLMRCFFALIMFFSLCMQVSAQTTVSQHDSLLTWFAGLRFGAFCHFNMNTFSGTWGCARQNPLKFNPTQLNCRQWVSAWKAAKMQFAILTAKHHDGFVIWPSKMTPPNGQSLYTIAQSSVPTRDVVADFTTACRDSGIAPCIFYSVHDVANGITSTTSSTMWAQDSTFILGQITELLKNYGPISIFCTDGYGWYMGHSLIPYQSIRDTIRKLQPNCMYFDHCSVTSPWEEDVVYYEEPKGGIYCPATNIYSLITSHNNSNGKCLRWPDVVLWKPQPPRAQPTDLCKRHRNLESLSNTGTAVVQFCHQLSTRQFRNVGRLHGEQTQKDRKCMEPE